jgi:heme-degrading monooxygenase HmoA
LWVTRLREVLTDIYSKICANSRPILAKGKNRMSVRILIKRHVPTSVHHDLTTLLHRLRSLTLKQPGYISGTTLQRVDDPTECIVDSNWRSLEDWNNWFQNPERIAIQAEIDELLGQETEYHIYEYL